MPSVRIYMWGLLDLLIPGHSQYPSYQDYNLAECLSATNTIRITKFNLILVFTCMNS